ncbi:MAG: methyltransferase, partial [Planctomycetota bacterium]
EHRRRRPELNEHFNAWLQEAATPRIAAILTAYDFSSFATVADVGGGHGALLAAILKTHPCAAGILFDLPHVVAGARPRMERAGVESRCRIIAGDFFDRIPGGADVLILKSVIHDWDDARGLAILRNCHRALVDRGTLLLIERILPDRAEQDPDTIFMDLHMLAVTGGRERSEAAYRGLLVAAGFTMKRTIPIGSSFCIIESIRAEAGKPERDQPVR